MYICKVIGSHISEHGRGAEFVETRECGFECVDGKDFAYHLENYHGWRTQDIENMIEVNLSDICEIK